MSTDVFDIENTDKDFLSLAESVIRQTNYEMLDTFEIEPVSDNLKHIRTGDVTCLFQIKELVFSRDEGSIDRFSAVLNALHACGASCVLLLKYVNGRSELYIGAVNKQKHENIFYLNTIRDVLKNGIEGNLPGTELHEVVSRKEIEQKISQSLDNGFDCQCITSVSCVASEQADERRVVNGIETLLEAMGNKNFSIMILADPVHTHSMNNIKKGYENLSTKLSELEQVSVSYQTGTSSTFSEGYSKSFSKSIGQNISLTQSHTTGSGWNNPSDPEKIRSSKILSTGAMLITPIAGSMISTLATAGMGTVSGHEDTSRGFQVGKNTSEQISDQKNYGVSSSNTEGTTISYSTHDRHIKDLLDDIEWYLQWLNKRENYGMFHCCAYIISSGAGINLMVASQYQALMQGRREFSQPVSFNTWTRENGIEKVKEYLRHFSHPVLKHSELEQTFTPSMLMSSKELSRQFALPQSSVVGVSVMEYASFGREVVRKTPLKTGKVIRVGSISHMGKTLPNQPVILDVQSMASHTFVAGTNGSGKSNTIFKIIEGFIKTSIPFMVIEPAKGEYKNVFGHRSDVNVYGTNRKKAPLLYLNPFWFNNGVAVLEHIDKLVEVFNASWSMYAAMPAILKSSIESAYVRCGWNLVDSECKGGHRVFPTVKDVLDEFQEQMNSTAFSGEVKGNYVGALSTRMESLCNGIYGEIFGGMNLNDSELFDRNVIIDLSRVGSSETKSMIMGILIIRLQEYRMNTEAMNLPLKHITVLEEAHNLLRRTSSAQSDEGSNMLGKSVEMISNAIAEMRSFGEGFIIVDQSPGLLDMSVMRNTNTKMILRLPEGSDRELVGNTMGLTNEQIYELSRLKTGTCAIYQRDWLQAVLCQVDVASHEEKIYRCPDCKDSLRQLRANIVKRLCMPFLPSPASETADTSKNYINDILECSMSGKEKTAVIKELSNSDISSVRKKMISDYAEEMPELPDVLTKENVDEWYTSMLDSSAFSEIYGKIFSPVIANIIIGQRALFEECWQKVMAFLPHIDALSYNKLKILRGIAFRRICPLDFRLPQYNNEELNELHKAVGILASLGGIDSRLAELLDSSLRNDTIRKRGIIQPYADIVWELLGGQSAWDSIFQLIISGEHTIWDNECRKLLENKITADRDTQTSLLSLFLQKKGAVPTVKKFYALWINANK